MADELGARERRYLEAYLELESQAAAAPAPDLARERVLAAAFGEADPLAELEAAIVPPRRSPRRGALLLAGVGLCAAAAVAWWMGRAALVESATARTHEQAERSVRGDRAVHEATAARRGSGQGGGAEIPTEDGASAGEPPSAGAGLQSPAATSHDARSSSERKPASSRRPAESQDAAGPEHQPAVPTLSTAEVELLDRARRLAQRGEHEAALARLREHASRFPKSVLATERVAEEVAVLCRMGAASAEPARASFLAGDPPQYLRTRVAKACAP